MNKISFHTNQSHTHLLKEKIFGLTLLEHQIAWAFKVKSADQVEIKSELGFDTSQLPKQFNNSVVVTQDKQLNQTDIPINKLALSETESINIETPSDISLFCNAFKSKIRRQAGGLVAKHINKRLSLPVSTLLAKHQISPNAISFFALFLTLLGGLILLTHQSVALAFFLFQLNSILDGCDGEVARMNLCFSDFGKKLDVFSDYATTTVVFFIGGYVLSKQQLFVWLLCLTLLVLTALFWPLYKLITGQKLALETIEGIHHNKVHQAKNPLEKFNLFLLIISKRDFWIFALWILALLNLNFLILPYLLVLSFLWLMFSVQTWWWID